MVKISPWPFISLLLLLFVSEFFISSCATRSSPSGGPRDTTAPVIDTTFPPNFSTHFEGNSVQIIFNEYIRLKSPSQQINFSPPLEKKPEILPTGKEINISWEDSLLPKTTYTISFGNSITDFTEGNVNDDFKYVFSTGDFIDSLELRGSVVNSRTGTPEKELLVALYDLSNTEADDSIAFVKKPTYYGYTDEAGNFSLTNLKYGNYHVVAFEDKRGNFQLNTGTEKIAFLSDTLALTDSTASLELYSFTPKGEDRFFGAKHSAWGKVQFPFNYPVPGLKVEPLYDSVDTSSHYLTFNPTKDTATYWFDQSERDSLVLVLSQSGQILDTPVLFLRPFQRGKFRLSPLKTEITFEDTLLLNANFPIASVSREGFLLYTPEDTLKIDSIRQPGPLQLHVVPKEKKPEYKLYIKQNAVESFTGMKNDSLNFSIKTLKRSDLGTLDFVVEADSSQSLVLLAQDPDKSEILRQSFRGNTQISLRNKVPGIYSFELIVDEDGNGAWSPGNYLKGIQPERIIKYQEQAEIRANWELELIWQPEIGPGRTSQSKN